MPLAGGRTNLVWRVDGAGPALVLKLYRLAASNPLFRNDPVLEAVCLAALEGSGLAPRLRAQGESDGYRWVLYEHASGTCWQRDPAPVARLLRDLHRRAPASALPLGPDGSADLARQTRTLIALCPEEDRAGLLALAPGGEVPPARRRVPIHGDPVPGNILTGPGGLCLIDWQCPAFGDPAEDLALFLSPGMQHVYRGAPLSAAERAEFLAAYGDPVAVQRYAGLRPWFGWRMTAYCLWRDRQGAADYHEAYRLERADLAG
ncbi:phosphotransferase [Cribrihabitans sp. XS_ASV171]